MLQPQQQLTENYEIYLGPREYARLHNLERDRDYTMFYGIFSPVSRFMVGVMRWMHDNVYANWGVAIILLTLLIRIIVWPLMLKSYTSMKKMGLLAPEIKKVQEKFKDDPTKQQTEMMKVYGQYGLSPFSFMGGCLPMLLQLPIFIGLYGVLDIAAELRGQSFLWVSDLSGPDIIYTLPFYGLTINPLPLVMMVSNFLQMKLTPQPPTVDKTQQNIFMMMPFIFLFICYNFAAALALYWTTQNLFSIFQTFVQNKLMKPVTLTKLSPDQLKNKGESPFAKMIQEQSRRSQGK
jgi:YidC/Oxa1 family membrane protein insertase